MDKFVQVFCDGCGEGNLRHDEEAGESVCGLCGRDYPPQNEDKDECGG